MLGRVELHYMNSFLFSLDKKSSEHLLRQDVVWLLKPHGTYTHT